MMALTADLSLSRISPGCHPGGSRNRFPGLSRLAAPGPVGAVPALARVAAVHGPYLELQFEAPSPCSPPCSLSHELLNDIRPLALAIPLTVLN